VAVGGRRLTPVTQYTVERVVSAAVERAIPRSLRSEEFLVTVKGRASDDGGIVVTAEVALSGGKQLEQDFYASVSDGTARATVKPPGPSRLVDERGNQLGVVTASVVRPPERTPPRPYAATRAEPLQATTSGVAIAAFITSLVGLWLAAIPLGLYAQRTIDESRGRLTGRGFATAGVVLGCLGLLATVILVVIIVSAAGHHPGCTYTYNATGGCVPGT
jgi:hypothetical protein